MDPIQNLRQVADSDNINDFSDIYDTETITAGNVNKACDALDVSSVRVQKWSIQERESVLKKNVKVSKSVTEKLNLAFYLNISVGSKKISTNIQTCLTNEYEQPIQKLK